NLWVDEARIGGPVVRDRWGPGTPPLGRIGAGVRRPPHRSRPRCLWQASRRRRVHLDAISMRMGLSQLVLTEPHRDATTDYPAKARADQGFCVRGSDARRIADRQDPYDPDPRASGQPGLLFWLRPKTTGLRSAASPPIPVRAA